MYLSSIVKEDKAGLGNRQREEQRRVRHQRLFIMIMINITLLYILPFHPAKGKPKVAMMKSRLRACTTAW